MSENKTDDKQETPRTDVFRSVIHVRAGPYSTADWMRLLKSHDQLERELAEANDKLAGAERHVAVLEGAREARENEDLSARGDIEKAAMAMEMYLVESGQTPHYAKLIADQRIRNLK